MKHLKSSIILIGLMTLIVVAWGSDVGTLNTFTSGSTISSAAVNANFAAIKTAVNSKLDQSSAPGTDYTLNANATGSSTYTYLTSGSVTNMASVTVSTPGPGYVQVTYSGYLYLYHSGNTASTGAGIGLAQNTTSNGAGYVFASVPPSAAVGYYSLPISGTSTYTASGQITGTFHVNGSFTDSNGSDTVRLTNIQLTALYVPNKY